MMKLYNTLTNSVDEFEPFEKNVVRMYTCGPTVYHYAHIGNLRTYIFEDILQKGLEYIGYDVKRCMNITDVGHLTSDGDTGEDKMLKGARREHKSVYEIAEFYTDAFMSDIDSLNIKKPEIIEKASDHIDMYIKMIQKLIDDGYAYLAGGNVYFDITKANNYYELSGREEEDQLVGVRDSVSEDKSKRNPHDFALWFTLSKFEDQAMKWDSPWGIGYPGWHIECSGISILELGNHLDIHCGGVDNIFPHHTNEIAQSEAYLGHKWCNFWCHGAHLNDIEGKMSKSKGEFLTISLLKSKGYSPLDYRYYCLNSHYRNTLVFSYSSLDGAKSARNKLKNRIKELDNVGELDKDMYDVYNHKFIEALENDLNTSNMLTVLYDTLKDDKVNSFTKFKLIESFEKVLSLGLFDNEINSDFKSYIENKILERKIAKNNKDYKLADEIRDELLKKGVILSDSKDGTTYSLR